MKKLLSAALLWLPLTAAAQAWPAKPIRLVAPYPPGGIDPFARVMMPKMSELLGQPIVLENRPGANGVIGTENVVRSPADGYTLLFATTSTLVGGTLMIKNIPYDPRKDLTPIIALFESLRTFTVPTSMPIHSIRELIDYAKQHPGKLSYASSGIGSAFHLDGEIFKDAAGVDIVHVPYKGTAPMTMDIAAGRIELGIASLSNVLPHIQAGKLRLIGVFEKRRSPKFPDVATIAETLPGIERTPGWTGFLGPAGLPQPMVQRINQVARAAMDTPEVRAFHEKNGTVINPTTPEETAASLRAGLVQVASLMKKIGLKPE